MPDPKPKLIAIVGPTASGKSAMGMYLAQKLNGEVISADSRQVYKGMRVISRAERGHMVGIADPHKQFSAGAYAKQAEDIVDGLIYQAKKVPVVVGGTGFYAEALLRGGLPQVAPNAKLRAALNTKTLPQLLALLKKIDPKSAARVDPRNNIRLVRAIEVATVLGKVPALIHDSAYDVLWLGRHPPSTAHARAVRKGIEERLRLGMPTEAKRLRARLSPSRYRELGFEFAILADYLDKKMSREQLVTALANGERRYAKRQMRWFKRNPDIHWVSNKTEALRLAKKFLNGHS